MAATSLQVAKGGAVLPLATGCALSRPNARPSPRRLASPSASRLSFSQRLQFPALYSQPLSHSFRPRCRRTLKGIVPVPSRLIRAQAASPGNPSNGAGAKFDLALLGNKGAKTVAVWSYTRAVVLVLAALAVVLASPHHSLVQLLPDEAYEALAAIGAGETMRIFRASLAATSKLAIVCAAVTWMMRQGRIPAEAPVVLSKVAFQLILPSFLMTKVARTLASSSANIALMAIPLTALSQVMVGAALGAVCGRVVARKRGMASSVTGWHPTRPAASADEIAVSTAKAVGVPAEEFKSAIIPKLDTAATDALERAVALACAFGNSLTLPLLFLMELVSPADLVNAEGYLALFLAGWSPALWSVGYQIVSGPSKSDAEADKGIDKPKQTFWKWAADWAARLINPPLCGIFLGILIGSTQLHHYVLPPVDQASDAVAHLSLELASLAHLARSCMSAAALIGAAALPVQTIVLASSLVSSGKKKEDADENKLSIVPTDLAGTRVLLGVSIVRLFLLPAVVFGVITWLRSVNLFPLDPVCTLMLLIQSAMPSAQNLVLLLQLRPSTQPLAGKMASMLLRQYLFAMLPVTLWTSVFAAAVL